MIKRVTLGVLWAVMFWIALVIVYPFLPKSVAGIIQAIVPLAVPSANFQGTATSSAKFQGASGSGTLGHCPQYDATGLLIDSGAACAGAGATGNSVTSVTPVTVSANTTSDQQLIELSLSAGFLNSLGQPFLFNGAGVYTTPIGQTPTLTFKVKLCTVSGCGSGTVVTLVSIPTTATLANSTNNTWNLSFMGYTAATGATGNLEIHGPATVDLGALSTSPDSVFNDTNTAVSGNINLTAALFVDFTVATSTGSASNSITQRSGGVMPFAAVGAPVTSVGGLTGAVPGEGNGSKVQLFTGSDPATGNYAKYDANHNLVDGGAIVTSVGGLTGSVGGGWIFQQAQTAAASAELDFTACISASYDSYALELIDLVPASNNVEVWIQVSTNGGSTWDTTAGHYSWDELTMQAGTANAASDSKIKLINNTGSSHFSGHVMFWGPGGSSTSKAFVGQGFNDTIGWNYDGRYTQAAAFNAIRVLMSAGNITSGVGRCYGIAKQ